MRAARVVVIGLVVLVLASACGGGSGGLTGAELSWCQQYPSLVMAAHDDLFGDDAISNEFFSSYVELMSAGDATGASRLFQERYSDTYDQACRAAYESR